MRYYPDWDLVFLDIMKNGSNVFVSLFEYVMEKPSVPPYFERTPEIYMTVVRNPYDRLVSQFYHHNRRELNIFKNSIHHPFFKEWVKKTYKNGYNGDDGHYFSQTHIIRYYEYPLPYHIFKLETLVAHELFWFMNLSDERKKDIDAKAFELRTKLDLNYHHAYSNVKQGVWQTFYDSETIEICNNYFANDFKAFEYEMIEPSQFNKYMGRSVL